MLGFAAFPVVAVMAWLCDQPNEEMDEYYDGSEGSK